MGKNESKPGFALMSLNFRIRDFFSPPEKTLKEAGLKAGFQVLDFGCGPGGYILPLAQMVEKSGRVYALDTSHLAVKSVKNIIIRRHVTNVETIHSDGKTGLPSNSLDAVLLYDTFHDLKHPDEVLKELHRVLKGRGILSVNDHHLEESDLVAGITGSGFFKLAAKGPRTFTFAKS